MNLNRDKVDVDLCQFFKAQDLDIVNRWILSRFYSTLKELNKDLDSYKFNEAANVLYGFFWHEFCDWYLEIIKPEIKNIHNQVVMYKILEKSLRLLHPFMPFITEEIWQKLKAASIMVEPWPHPQEGLVDKKAERAMESAFLVIAAIRNMRVELEVPVADQIQATLCIKDQAKKRSLLSSAAYIRNLARLSELFFADDYRHAPGQYVSVVGAMHIVIPLAGVIDMDKFIQRIEERLAKAQVDIKNKQTILANKHFVQKAPAEVVAAERKKLAEFNETFQKLKAVKHALH